MWHPKKNMDPFLPVFSHFFMSYFDIFGSIFEKSAMTDFPKVIVSICLVSYNICVIPHVWTLTFGLNFSGAWGVFTHFGLLETLIFTCIKAMLCLGGCRTFGKPRNLYEAKTSAASPELQNRQRARVLKYLPFRSWKSLEGHQGNGILSTNLLRLWGAGQEAENWECRAMSHEVVVLDPPQAAISQEQLKQSPH